MNELWLSFIGAMIRFWDNRFNPKKCESCSYLKDQITLLQNENRNLIQVVMSPQTIIETGTGIDFSNLISTQQKTWTAKRRELEKNHRRDSPKKITVEDFERDIEELENAN